MPMFRGQRGETFEGDWEELLMSLEQNQETMVSRAEESISSVRECWWVTEFSKWKSLVTLTKAGSVE